MKKINYDDFIRTKKDKYFRVPALLGRRRLVRNKPRSPEERNALMIMDYQRHKTWVTNGILTQAALRRYILK